MLMFYFRSVRFFLTQPSLVGSFKVLKKQTTGTSVWSEYGLLDGSLNPTKVRDNTAVRVPYSVAHATDLYKVTDVLLNVYLFGFLLFGFFIFNDLILFISF